jgi:hypothetical protein
MRPFVYNRADDSMRLAALLAQPNFSGGPPTSAPAQIPAGGTTLIDLMRLDVMRPQSLCRRRVWFKGFDDAAHGHRRVRGATFETTRQTRRLA